MSRSGYAEGGDFEYWPWIRWRGAVTSALRGKRGQAFLRELLAALDALPAPRLIADDLVNEAGEVCMLGAVGKARGMDMDPLTIDPYDREEVAKAFGIAEAMAAEIMYENDEFKTFTPEQRFVRAREWVVKQIRSEP